MRKYSTCTAVLSSGLRCNEPISRYSYHCDAHHDKAKKMYVKYKKFGIKVDKLNLDNDDPYYLLKAYSILNKSYELRAKHRRYAFAEECHDAGHNYQFQCLTQKMNMCEEKLNLILNKKPVEQLIRQSDESEDEPFIDNNIQEKFKLCQNDRLNQKFNDDIFNRYIEENKKIKEDKALILLLIEKCVRKLINTDDYETGLIFLVAIERIISELMDNNYFDEGPKKCTCKGCDDYMVIYVTELFCNCGCIFKERNRLMRYLIHIHIDFLKKVYEILIIHKAKLILIIDKLKYYYVIHQSHMLFSSYEINFDNNGMPILDIRITDPEDLRKRKFQLKLMKKRGRKVY